MTKNHQLEAIARKIKACKVCRAGSTGFPVPGEGNPDARVVFIGEAPGKTEAETGRPFVGRSGRLLRMLIRDAGLREADVFITSPVKYLPRRGTPSAPQISHGWKHLRAQLDVIRPKVLVLLGSTACRAVLKRKVPVTEMHGQVFRESGMLCFITIHPAAALRFPPLREVLKQDFSSLKTLLAGKSHT